MACLSTVNKAGTRLLRAYASFVTGLFASYWPLLGVGYVLAISSYGRVQVFLRVFAISLCKHIKLYVGLYQQAAP